MIKENQSIIKFKIVDKVDINFLFDLLKEREADVSISHKKMPTFKEHKRFVLSKPYTAWYIILNNNKKLGSIYLSKQNEIGIFLKKEIQGKKIGQKVLKKIIEKHPRKKYLANVNPKNKISINFFKKNHFKLIQYTFELEK